MSTFIHVEIFCQSCGEDFMIPVLKGMHITRIPEYRKAILDRTFQVFPCPACGHSHRVEASTVYTDFERWHYIAVEEAVAQDLAAAVAREKQVFYENFTLGPPVANEFALNMAARCRLVIGVEAVREKLLIWDAGLDDRVVEALKGDRMAAMGLDPSEELWRVSTVFDGGHVMFARLEPPVLARAAEILAPQPICRGHETVNHAAYARRQDEIRAAGGVRQFPWLDQDWLVDLFFANPATMLKVAALA